MSGEKKKRGNADSETGGKSGKEGWAEWLIKRLDMPPDVLCGGMRVELRGRESLLVEGCRKILTYTPTLVRLRLSRCVLVIEGERLLCHSYLAGAVGLEGKVCALRFEEEKC